MADVGFQMIQCQQILNQRLRPKMVFPGRMCRQHCHRTCTILAKHLGMPSKTGCRSFPSTSQPGDQLPNRSPPQPVSQTFTDLLSSFSLNHCYNFMFMRLTQAREKRYWWPKIMRLFIKHARYGLIWFYCSSETEFFLEMWKTILNRGALKRFGKIRHLVIWEFENCTEIPTLILWRQ